MLKVRLHTMPVLLTSYTRKSNSIVLYTHRYAQPLYCPLEMYNSLPRTCGPLQLPSEPISIG
jgi:hypothetical protein